MQIDLCGQFFDKFLRQSLNLKSVTFMIRHTRGILIFHLSALHESVRSEHFEGHYSKLKLLSKNISVMFGYNVPVKCWHKFYVSLTVHLDVILVNDKLNALFLNVFISTLLHVSSSKCSSSGGPTCLNTPSGITRYGSKRV